VNLGPALLFATKEPQSDVALTMDSYYAEVVTTDCPYCMVEPFAADARAARTERRSAETQGLRRVTQSGMPLSYLPLKDAPQAQHPVREPAPPVVTDELGSFTPRQFRPQGDEYAHAGENEIDQDLLDAASLNHYSNKESDKEELPEGFGYLSELDPNYQGNLEFVVEKQLPRRGRSVLGDGSGGEEQSVGDHVDSGENGMPQEGPLHSLWPSQTVVVGIRLGHHLTVQKVGPGATVDFQVPRIWGYPSQRLGLSVARRSPDDRYRYAVSAYLSCLRGAEVSAQASPQIRRIFTP
jgi:hypothetical protein